MKHTNRRYLCAFSADFYTSFQSFENCKEMKSRPILTDGAAA